MPVKHSPKLGKDEASAAATSHAVTKTNQKSTALYLYLDQTLKSPRLRKMLQDGAEDHTEDAVVARRA